MKPYLLPIVLAVMSFAGAFSLSLLNANGLLIGKVWLLPYLYITCGLLLCFAVFLAGKQAAHNPNRPRVVPVRYGKLDEGIRRVGGVWAKPDGSRFGTEEVLLGRHLGKYGLFVVNEGAEAAYDISVSEPHVGTAKLQFETDKTRLSNGEGEAFFPALIAKGNGAFGFGSELFEEMRQQQIPEIEVILKYKDANNRWYRTVGKIERDVLAHGGLTVRHVR
jgi:hypothetical protein